MVKKNFADLSVVIKALRLQELFADWTHDRNGSP